MKIAVAAVVALCTLTAGCGAGTHGGRYYAAGQKMGHALMSSPAYRGGSEGNSTATQICDDAMTGLAHQDFLPPDTTRPDGWDQDMESGCIDVVTKAGYSRN